MGLCTPKQNILNSKALKIMQRKLLRDRLHEIYASDSFFSRKFRSIDFDPLKDPISRLPLTTRSEIEQDQVENPPYGSVMTHPVQNYSRFHQTSGTRGVPLRYLDTTEGWRWLLQCWHIAYQAARLAKDSRLVFPFSFGPFSGFWSAFEAACSLGFLCLPAGGMTTRARIQYILENGATVICATPSYALHITDVAIKERIPLRNSMVNTIIVTGEPGGSIGSVRSRIEKAWGARVIDQAGMTETGPWGVECHEAPGGLHIIESEFIAEVIDPLTEVEVQDGVQGELVLTSLGRIGNPLIRYRTGDLCIRSRGKCSCGRSWARLEGGILGRIDEILSIPRKQCLSLHDRGYTP